MVSAVEYMILWITILESGSKLQVISVDTSISKIDAEYIKLAQIT
jgi:hypothetical protein